MTIKRKNIRPSGLLEVEADPTDTVDTGGFSDTISTVSAKTAKFSGGGTMQSNAGKRIGLTQVKINGGVQVLRSGVVESNSGWNNPNNGVDVNLNTFANTSTLGSTVVYDFASINTINLFTKLGNTSGTTTTVIRVEISQDDVSYSFVADVTLPGAGGGPATITTDHGVQIWRYVRLTYLSQTVATDVRIYEVFEDDNSNTITARIRSSISIDTVDGTILTADIPITPNSTTTLDDELLLTGTPSGDFITLELVSLGTIPFPISLSEITSITEV